MTFGGEVGLDAGPGRQQGQHPLAGAIEARPQLVGLAGAGVIVMAITALTVLFSTEERPKAVGIWAAANSLALPIGPILGGWLLTNYWWGWMFLINVPVVILGSVLSGGYLSRLDLSGLPAPPRPPFARESSAAWRSPKI